MTVPQTRQILIIDDEESMLLLMRRVVESIPGVAVTLADGCEQGMELAGRQAFDLILLDLLMPGVGGIEVLNRIRAGSQNARTAVIIVSVMSDSATRVVCQSLGASDYVVKPIERERLVAAVKAQLNPD